MCIEKVLRKWTAQASCMLLGNLCRGGGSEPQLKSCDCLQVAFIDKHCGPIKDNNFSIGFFGMPVLYKMQL